MSSPAAELLARVIAQQITGENCEECGHVLRDSCLKVRAIQPEFAVVEVVCQSCAHVMVLQIKPEDDGVANLR